jgi:hypothetical protein
MRRAAVFCVLLLVGSAVLGATVFREEVAQAAQAILPVKVVNTAAEPVPVALGGTASVQVADEREPFETRLDADADDGFFIGSDGFTVPAGKRLVVEFIDVSVRVPKGQVPTVGVNTRDGALGFSMPLQFQGTQATSVGTNDIYTGGMKTLDFAESGEFYDIFFSRDRSDASGLPPGNAHMIAYLSGYLMDD